MTPATEPDQRAIRKGSASYSVALDEAGVVFDDVKTEAG